MSKKILAIIITALVLLCVAFYAKFTIFVVPQIPLLSKGETYILRRQADARIIDSTDAACLRTIESVNDLCRGIALAANSDRDIIFARLPYMHLLFMLSKINAK